MTCQPGAMSNYNTESFGVGFCNMLDSFEEHFIPYIMHSEIII